MYYPDYPEYDGSRPDDVELPAGVKRLDPEPLIKLGGPDMPLGLIRLLRHTAKYGTTVECNGPAVGAGTQPNGPSLKKHPQVARAFIEKELAKGWIEPADPERLVKCAGSHLIPKSGTEGRLVLKRWRWSAGADSLNVHTSTEAPLPRYWFVARREMWDKCMSMLHKLDDAAGGPGGGLVASKVDGKYYRYCSLPFGARYNPSAYCP